MEEEIVRLEGVSIDYSGIHALENINLSIMQDDFLGIMGPNGGGKSTLLKVILGLVRPDRGKVTVFGKSPELGRHYVSYVPQHFDLDTGFPISVLEVVMLGRKKGERKDALEALRKVGMDGLWGRHIGELSGGQRQRVFIARALISKPKLLLLDEPTASIDTEMGDRFYKLLGKLNKEMAVVLVTHDIGALSAYVKTVACLNRRLHYHGPKDISQEVIDKTYQCPIELLAHGVSHRVLGKHKGGKK